MYPITPGQIFCGIIYVWATALWLYAEVLQRQRKYRNTSNYDMNKDMEDGVPLLAVTAKADAAGHGGEPAPKPSPSPRPAKEHPSPRPKALMQDIMSSGLVRCMSLDADAIHDARGTLHNMFEFGTIMAFFYACDRTGLFWESEKSYSRDVFLFIFLVLVLVAGATSLRSVRAPQLLNRAQTEEWKGWMQVLFLLYHYFEAREAYNAIRVFIAGYVWLTGYGNFSYYYKTGDFSIGRFCQMMWRLNFLVIFCCLVLNNSYMLYYICPMHTIFTVFVYGALGLGHQLNKNNVFVLFKMALCVGGIALLWDIKRVFYALWGPLDWLVGYTDPRKSSGDRLYEWFFRSGLDRYVWIHGMLCAFINPTVTAALVAVDNMPRISRYSCRLVLTGAVLAVGLAWYWKVFTLPKLEYNKVHPYTSWIPLSCWVLVRNLTPYLRTVNLRLFGWLGCITLETYLCQFHIWLHTEMPDGQPKMLLTFLPGYPLLNFALCTAVYVYISHRLFELTNSFKNVSVPHDDDRLLGRNFLMLGLISGGLYATSWGLMHALIRPV